MDATSLVLISKGIGAARALADAVLKTRDTVKYGPVIAQMNEQLINVQGGLVTHNAEMMELQQKYYAACDELRRLKAVAAERECYSLHEIGPGVFAYRLDTSKKSEPLHYLCQPCFDKGVKSVLQDLYDQGPQTLGCNVCNAKYSTGVMKPYRDFHD